MKLLSILSLVIAIATSLFAQNKVDPIIVKGVSNGNSRTDFGLSVPLREMRYFNVNAWVLTDTKTVKDVRFGAGVSFNPFKKSTTSILLNGGYVFDDKNSFKFTKGHFSVGMSLQIRL